ncbi:uncharacterized protein LOC116006846 [Ipomoea triloba]|uniref:uncharacterized protein LOC116006846 n=1 Tax=Ipomoea triloba TaxID=35885 RepID=UPI00125D7ED7|nr:uncharacterized protein LOC116006846 [Ipomoea triloba]
MKEKILQPAEYALFLLMDYLTDAWGLGFAYAAAIINIWTGLSKLLILCGAYLVDKIGNYRMLLYSTIVYSIGLAFLYMSTPAVLDNMAGNCGEDRAECYGPAQKATFYISLVLKGLGMAGHAVSLDPYLHEKDVNEKVHNIWSLFRNKSLGNNLTRAVIAGVSSWLLPQRWSARFGIVAIYGFAATIALAIGNMFKNETEYKSEDIKINFCKMLNQTAMIWTSFIMCGVVSSLGNTFFVEQADRMKPTAGIYTVPLGVLLLIAHAAKFILKQCYHFSYTLIMKIIDDWCDKIAKHFIGVEVHKPLCLNEVPALLGNVPAMLNALLCCLAAAVVENLRRKDTMKKYLHHDSKFWLVPQFIFVISIDAFLQVSVNGFFHNYYESSPEGKDVSGDQSLKKYSIQFTNFLMGLGFIGSVVSVLAVAKISESVSGKSWIQKEVSDSRLENYYWLLAVLCSVNIVYYVLAAICYTRKAMTAAGDAPHQPRDKTGCCSCYITDALKWNLRFIRSSSGKALQHPLLLRNVAKHFGSNGQSLLWKGLSSTRTSLTIELLRFLKVKIIETLSKAGSEPDEVMGQSKSSSCLRTLIMWTLASHVRWFNIAAEYALFLLMTYLTDAWGLGFAYAAGIINIWTGLSKLLSLYGASMVDKFGNYRVLLYSSIVYSIGLTFLYMSTPPVLDNMAGNCGEDRPKCYGPAQKGTFYISLVLTGVGMAGHTVSLDPFLDEQVNEKKGNSSCFCSPRNLANYLMRAVINGVSSWLLPQRWGARFGIVAIYGFAATMALAIANRFFNDDEKPTTSEDNKIDFSKMFKETAMVWPSFIMCGVVSSFGNTFFVEQADRMKPTAGVFTVPLGVLLLLTKAAEFILKHCYGFSYTLMKIFFKLCGKLTKNCYGFDADKISALFGIGTAMYNAVLCCLVAAVVENARRKDTMKKYLHHDSKFWLVPQFVFLIGIDAFLEESIHDFFKKIAPLYKSSSEKKEDQSMQNYIIQFTNFVMGLGFIGSVVSVLAVARISKSVTGKSWIQKEVSDSRLENYYWVLTVLSSINIVYYVFAAIWYTVKLREATKISDAAAGDHPQQPRGETGCCSCYPLIKLLRFLKVEIIETLSKAGSEPDKVMGQCKCSNCCSLSTLIMWTLASHVKWFNIAAEYALFLLMAYLTDAWGLGFAHAAAIINIWTGFSKLLSLYGAYLTDKNQGIENSRMLLYSSIVYSIGLAFLYMSTPPVLDNMAGNCSEDRPDCYGPAQKATFYISLVLTGVGMAGHAVSLDPFLDERGVNAEGFCNVKSMFNKLMRGVIAGVSSFLLPQHWSARFGIVAIYGFAATIALAIANGIYKEDENKTKEIANGTYKEDEKKTKKKDEKINFCKMLNQTAMVWPSFIMCGVVSSIGNTFFVEQADRMKPTAGVYTVPLGVLLLLANAAKFILTQCFSASNDLMKKVFGWCHLILKNCFGVVDDGIKKLAPLFGIGIAMLNAVLCCLAAAVVENIRRKDTMKEYLHHDSKFWLVPQFVFLIAIDAFLQVSVTDFFQNYKSSSPEENWKEDQSLKKYSIQFTNFVMGLGFIGSVVSVLAVARISKSVSGKSWIQKEVTDSRLENYYWVLAVLSSINVVYYVIAAICYSRKAKKAPNNNTAAGCCSC